MTELTAAERRLRRHLQASAGPRGLADLDAVLSEASSRDPGPTDDLRDWLIRTIHASGVAQNTLARRSGMSEKHVSQMLNRHVAGSLNAWQRLLTAARLPGSRGSFTTPMKSCGGARPNCTARLQTDHKEITMRTFTLRRDHDVSGVSGIGTVAEGVEFSDGTVALRWVTGEHRSTVIWPGIDSVEAIHGHGGATRVVWS